MPSNSESQAQARAKRPELKLSIPGRTPPNQPASSDWDPRKASELEKQRLQGNAFYKQETEKLKSHALHQHHRNSLDPMSGTTLRGTAPSTLGTDTRTSDQPSNPRQPSPAVTTWSFLNASTPDLPSSKKLRRDPKRRPDPLKLVPANNNQAQPTERQHIEARDEKQLQKMMGMNPSPAEPSTPRVAFESPTEESHAPPMVSVRDLSRSGSKKSQAQAPRSPQKKVLGISIPFTRSKSPVKVATLSEVGEGEDVPPVPFLPGVGPKAHQVLGTGKKVPVPILRRPQRSQTTTSLPQELFEKDDSDDEAPKPPVKFASMNSNVRYKGVPGSDPTASESFERPSSHSPSKALATGLSPEKSHSFPASPPSSASKPPPTPPEKDTPPHLKRENTSEGTGLGITTDHLEANNANHKSLPVAEGEVSAVKAVSSGYIAKSSLVQKVPSIYSMHASVVEGQSRSAGFDPVAGFLTPQQHVGRWSDGQKEFQRRLDGLLPGGLLPPTCYYSPSIYSQSFETPKVQPLQKFTDRLAGIKEEHSRHVSAASYTTQTSEASIPVFFQGRELDITPEPTKKIFETPTKLPFRPKDASKTDITSISRALLGVPAEHPTAQSFSQPADTAPMTQTYGMRSQVKIDEAQRLVTGQQGGAAEPSQENTALPNDRAMQPPPQSNGPIKPALPVGLTPLLEQELNKTDSPIRRSHLHFNPESTSAMPTPLYGHLAEFPPPPPAMVPAPFLPDPSIVTHFDVVHHHLVDIATSLHHATHANHENTITTINVKHDETLKVVKEHFVDLRAGLHAVEHSMGRASAETEVLRATTDKLATTVQEELVGRLEALVEVNRGLSEKIGGLETTVGGLARKLETLLEKERGKEKQDWDRKDSVVTATPSASMTNLAVGSSHPHPANSQQNLQAYDMQPQYQHYGYPMRQHFAHEGNHGRRDYMVTHGMGMGEEAGQHQERMGQGQGHPYGNAYYRNPYGGFQQAK